MTPERAEVVLRALAESLTLWIEELRGLEECCPARAGHLLATMKQAQRSLQALMDRDAAG